MVRSAGIHDHHHRQWMLRNRTNRKPPILARQVPFGPILGAPLPCLSGCVGSCSGCEDAVEGRALWEQTASTSRSERARFTAAPSSLPAAYAEALSAVDSSGARRGLLVLA